MRKEKFAMLLLLLALRSCNSYMIPTINSLQISVQSALSLSFPFEPRPVPQLFVLSTPPLELGDENPTLLTRVR